MERARVDLLDVLLDEHAKQTKLEAFLAALEADGPETAPRVERLRRWAEERLQRLRGRTAGSGLETRLVRDRLSETDE